jgi:hypothetical protein
MFGLLGLSQHFRKQVGAVLEFHVNHFEMQEICFEISGSALESRNRHERQLQSQVIFVSWRTRIGHGGKNSVNSLSMLLTGDGVLLLIMMVGTTTKMVICGHRG